MNTRCTPTLGLYVGIDVHKDTHTAVGITGFDETLFQDTIGNTDDDFAELRDRIADTAAAYGLSPIIGIEDSSSYGSRLARYLHDQGFPVKTVNPRLVDRQRSKETHPEKSDSLDALEAARVLVFRTDRLPTYSISEASERAQTLKELSVDRDFLLKERARLKNQLHHLLYKSYNTQYQRMFKDPFSLRALRYFEAHPTPSGEHPLLARQIRRKVERLIAMRDELKEVERDMDNVLAGAGTTLTTLNGCGTAMATQILGEIKDVSRFPSEAALAKYAGIAPRQCSSGKTIKHLKSVAGNRRLNMAIHRVALSQISISGNDAAKRYFRRKVENDGKSKQHALRCLKRQLVKVIYQMLKNETVYQYPQEKTCP
jgi:transposase